MMMKQKTHRITKPQLNNKGFSLVELLVAVIILAIIVVPVMHAFVSAANTNAKSNETLVATTLCEDVMEELNSMTAEAFSLKYGGVKSNTGVYTVEITGDNYDTNASNYELTCVMDPGADGSKYDGWNKKNVTDINAITSDSTGVFAMLMTEDNTAYNYFLSQRGGAASDYATLPGSDPLEWLRENVTRTITLVLSSSGQMAVVDAEGNAGTVRHVKAMLSIEYTCPQYYNGKKVSDYTTYKSDSYPKEVYNNLTSRSEFKGIYILYSPTYHTVNVNKDYIYIQNEDNIPGIAYVIHEKTAADDANPNLIRSYKALIELKENPSWGLGGLANGVNNDGKSSALRIYTNLYDTTAADIKTADTYFNLKYSHKLTTVTALTDNATCMKAMTVRSADGRTFDGTPANTRIYSVSITAKKGSNTLATMTGTKIQ